jgi:DNA-binding YbaB/EbfC family protein
MQPGEMHDMQQLMAQAQQIQQQLVAAQAELANSEVTGEAGNGLVAATMKGTGHLVALRIDPSVVDPSDVETLQDLVIGAINDAAVKVAQVASNTLGPLANGAGLPGLPNFG